MTDMASGFQERLEQHMGQFVRWPGSKLLMKYEEEGKPEWMVWLNAEVSRPAGRTGVCK